MVTKFTAAQLRGLKAEQDKELKDTTINRTCLQISALIQTYAKKGETKITITFTEGFVGYKLIYPEPGSGSTNYYKVDADFIKECCTNLSNTFVDCIITDNIEVDKKLINHMITIDWSEEKPKDKVIQQDNFEALRVKIIELEDEIKRLKVSNPIGDITTNLIEILSGFGKIN